MNAMTKLDAPKRLVLSGTGAFALEAEMLDDVSSGLSPFRVAVWETERCLVVPQAFTRNHGFERAATMSRASGWPVLTRCTGGDVTPQGPGTLNVTLAYRLPAGATPSIDEHYDLLCTPIARQLERCGLTPDFSAIPHSFCDGAHNLSIQGRKMVGTAQRWRRIQGRAGAQMVFAHALILVNADLPEGIAATNRLYAACGMADRVREEVHVNLRSLVTKATGADLDAAAYASDLREAYVQTLGDLTA